MLGLGRERGSDLMGTARGSVFIIGFFFTGCAPDDGILVLKGFKGDLHEWSKIKAICKYFYFIFFKEVEYYRDWSKKRSEFVWDFFNIKNE